LRRRAKDFREAADKKLVDVVRETGVPKSSLSAFENGEQGLPEEHLLALAEYYKTKPEILEQESQNAQNVLREADWIYRSAPGPLAVEPLPDDLLLAVLRQQVEFVDRTSGRELPSDVKVCRDFALANISRVATEMLKRESKPKDTR